MAKFTGGYYSRLVHGLSGGGKDDLMKDIQKNGSNNQNTQNTTTTNTNINTNNN